MLIKTITASLALLAASIVQAQADDQVILKISHFLSPNSTMHQKVMMPWCDKLSQESMGKIKCQIYPAMQLGGTPSQLADQVRNGVADIAYIVPSYSSGRFPIVEALELPFMMVNSIDGSRVAWAFYQAHAVQEFSAYKVLAVHIDGGSLLSTVNAEVTKLDDFKGLKVRVASREVAKAAAALGAAPVSMPAAQVTEALSKGVVDGAFTPWELTHQLKLDEVTHFHIVPPEGKPMFGATVLAVLMNKQKYESLSPELKAIIDRNTGDALVENIGQAWEVTSSEARKAAEARGNKIVTLSPDAYNTMVKATAAVEAEWVSEVAAKGIDGKALVDDVRAITAKLAPVKATVSSK